MSRFLLTMMLCVSSWMVTSCVTYISEVGECPDRSKLGNDQFMEYRAEVGENHHVQDDLRLARFCQDIEEHTVWFWNWEFWKGKES